MLWNFSSYWWGIVGAEDGELTVDSDGNGLSQDEVVRADEGGNSAQRVQLEVLGVHIGRSGFDKFDIKLVLLRQDELDDRASVIRKSVKLSERHLDLIDLCKYEEERCTLLCARGKL